MQITLVSQSDLKLKKHSQCQLQLFYNYQVISLSVRGKEIVTSFFSEVLEHFQTSMIEDSQEEYCPYFQDGVAIQQLSRAMLGLRFQPGGYDGSEAIAIAAGQSINVGNSARDSELIDASFELGGRSSRITVRLDGGNQYNNLLVTPNNEFGISNDWRKNVSNSEHFFSQNAPESDYLTPDSMKELKYGFTVYCQWFEYIGMALGTCLIRFGSEALSNDIDSHTPTLQASWDWLAKNLKQSDSAWE